MQGLVDRLARQHAACIVSPSAAHVQAATSTLVELSLLQPFSAADAALLAKSELVPTLVSMLSAPEVSSSAELDSHVITLVEELTDTVLGLREPEEEEEEDEKDQRAKWLLVVNRMMDCGLPEVCVSLNNIDVFAQSVQFLDNLCEIYPSAAPAHLAERTELLAVDGAASRLLLSLQQQGEDDVQEAAAAAAKLACSELVCVVMNASAHARRTCDAGKVLLPAIHTLSSIGGGGGSAERDETAENLVSAVSRLVLNHSVRKEAVGGGGGGGGGGVDLSLALIRQNTTLGKRLGFKLASSLVRNCASNCRLFVDQGGLKVALVFLLATTEKNNAAAAATHKRMRGEDGEEEEDADTTSSALAVLAALCLHLDGVYLSRLKAKLHEPGKLASLIELHHSFAARVAGRIAEFDQEDDEEARDDEDEEYLDLCEHGLTELQNVDIALASVDCAALGASFPQQADVAQVLADLAEKEMVLDGDDEVVVAERATLELKARLVGLAAAVVATN